MRKINLLDNGIPVSPSLNPTLEAEQFEPPKEENKKRLLIISSLVLLIAVVISFVAKFLIILIDLITNISFYQDFSFTHRLPAQHTLGIFILFVPVIGGIIVGLMALYGSKAIRGHGIPEAMEQILTNQSKIKPAITYLKPLSSAIAIGTGGPFGAEGPIIATGGALGSTIGQLLKISHNERKILLAAGATAGMAAIFGSPIAAIFLAVELLLFEFSPRSLIPVAIACIVGAAGHHFLFDAGPVFKMPNIPIPSNKALLVYCVLGIVMGVLSVGVSKAVYLIEEIFEKIPIHWMWWPAIGGIVVGIIGYFSPLTLGVGYENIINILSGTLPMHILISLCVLKFISWAVALGSGTSGGTLAPLLTIGGAAGALLGSWLLQYFPQSDITISLAALVGMASIFAGASRALLTSIIFALETTYQSNALLPLLGACLSSYLISFMFMKNTIMTEKIARRGIKTPQSYEPDILGQITVEEMIQDTNIVLSEDDTILQTKEWLREEKERHPDYFIVASKSGEYKGVVNINMLHGNTNHLDRIASVTKSIGASVRVNDTLRTTVETMAREDSYVLPVVEGDSIIGVISHQEILSAYKQITEYDERMAPQLSIKRGRRKLLLRGQKLVSIFRKKDKYAD